MKFCHLKFLTDENISPRLVSFLRQKGIDVLDVKEQGWHGSDDKSLMNIAYNEKRFVLTHDSDFGTLAINEGILCFGIIYMRLRNLKIPNIINVFEKLLSIKTDISDGSLIVVEDTRIRIRKIVQ